MHAPPPPVRFSVLSSRFVGWGVLLLALAMALALSAEAVRAAVREGAHFLAPALLGLVLAGLTLWSKGWSHHRCTELLQKRLILITLFVVPFAFQLVLILAVRTQPASDWAAYWHSAQKLWHSSAYVCPVDGGLGFRARKPPGMAIYLMFIYAAFGESVVAAQVVNALLILGGNIIFYLVVRHRLGRQVAVCAAALYAFWPSRNFSVALLSYDAPGSFVVLLFWLLVDGPWKGRWYVTLLAGIAAGSAAMLRQPLLLLPAALLASRLFTESNRRALIKEFLLLLLGLSAVVGPWTYRNYRLFGTPLITSTIGGPSLFRSFHPDAGRYYTNVGWEQLMAESGGEEIKLNQLGWHHGLTFIAADPLGAVIRILRNWQRLFESDHEIAGLVFDTPGGPLRKRFYQISRSAACGVSDVWYAWLAFATLLASIQVLRSSKAMPDLLWPVLAIASAVAVHGVFESQPRYFVLYQCFWAILVAATWRKWQRIKRKTPVQGD